MIPLAINPFESALYTVAGPMIKAAMGESPVNIDGYELQELINRNPDMQLIDVRTPAEYKQVRVPGATYVGLGNVNAGISDGSISKNKPLVFLCQSGFRAYMAGLLANTYGYRNVYNLEGGTIGAWVDKGLPTEGEMEEGEEIIRGGC